MKTAYIFPGQGAQFVGMGKNLYDGSVDAKGMFEKANDLLKFRITDLMFAGADDDLRQTRVTQPAIFLHSVILAHSLGDSFRPDMVAGHSLGEFSALVAAKALSFDDGLLLVSKRAIAMQKACELQPSTMAAIIGLDDKVIEEICNKIDDIVVPANYNSIGQCVISGTFRGVELACERLKEAGAKRTMPLKVGGAFHSPIMEPARLELAEVIRQTVFHEPICKVFQNVNGLAVIDPELIKSNLLAQLTSPVMWTQTVNNMIADGANKFVEVGPGNVLQGLVKKINPEVEAVGA